MDQCIASIYACPLSSTWPFEPNRLFIPNGDVENLISGSNLQDFGDPALKQALLNEEERIKEIIASFNKTFPLPEVRKSQKVSKFYEVDKEDSIEESSNKTCQPSFEKTVKGLANTMLQILQDIEHVILLT
ncbi:hypothetical protein NPIL_176531 [Nephila pilipes]|uniref:Uncharacterized protein n=1 Tax=Nephila pilipes TaxID=299642 RepID=A0A8X6P0U7_NEPPI|nr:hypothetical protein NPIL_176531 [Nephila pilipes]